MDTMIEFLIDNGIPFIVVKGSMMGREDYFMAATEVDLSVFSYHEKKTMLPTMPKKADPENIILRELAIMDMKYDDLEFFRDNKEMFILEEDGLEAEIYRESRRGNFKNYINNIRKRKVRK